MILCFVTKITFKFDGSRDKPDEYSNLDVRFFPQWYNQTH